MFTKLENDKPFLKLALEGFAGDGKTRTAAEIAIGVHKLIHSDKPIAIYDTEQAAKALKPIFDAANIEALVNKSRTLATLNQAIKWCEDGGADILMIDSITHVWENFLEAYKQDKIEKRKGNRLEFQDWGILKPKWKAEFSTVFVQANVHIIFTGRAGFEYEDEKDENGKRQIFKSGIKMKAEGETAFEPDILVLMEKVQDVLSDKKRIYRTATILKDRSAKIDGITLNEDGSKSGPSFDDFYPAISALLDGTIKEYAGTEIPDTFQSWEDNFGAISRKKDITIAEIEGAFNLMKLGTSSNDKQTKAWLLKNVFNALSVDKLKDLQLNNLQNGLEIIKEYANSYNLYMQECAENQTAPDSKNLLQILKDILAERQSNR